MFNKKLFNYIVYNQFGGKDGNSAYKIRLLRGTPNALSSS